MRRAFFLCFLIILLSGCYGKQIRHLASDASLIKPGQSTKKDVLLYLGEPDGHRNLSATQEEYVYFEDKRDLLTSAPLISDWTDADGYEMVLITIQGDLVTDCEFRTFHEDDRAWAEDFTWDDIE